jgi:hypothetical protein
VGVVLRGSLFKVRGLGKRDLRIGVITMQEAIEVESAFVRDPAITEAIRFVKSRLKDMAMAQRFGRREFKIAQRAFAKEESQVCVSGWDNRRMEVTALHVIDGKLRQSKHQHFPTSEMEAAYFNEMGLARNRKWAYNSVLESIPEAGRKMILTQAAEKEYQEKMERERQMAEEAARRKAEREERQRLAVIRDREARYAKYLELKKEFEP